MRIKKLELKNFRGFEELVIDFPEGESGLAVFVGVNGSGKTSVLDALGKLCNRLTIATQKEEEMKDLSPKIDDIKLGNIATNICFEFDFRGKLLAVNLETKENGATQITPNPIRLSARTQDFVIPLLAYYKTNREPLLVDVEEETNGWNGRFFSYSNAFANRVDDFNDLSKWFRFEEDQENQEKIERKDFDYVNPNLHVVREAVSGFLNYFDSNFNSLKVRRKKASKFDFHEPSKEWSLAISKDVLEFKLSQLSSGERSLISLVADISRRAAIANPQLPNPLMCDGVILIDEIELHLHPGWQRKVVGALHRTFPNIQFIVTTHSPQVLSTLKKENVFILDDFKLVKETPHTLGRDSNSILWDIFGVEKRPPEAEKIFSKLYRTMDDPDKVEETADLLRDVEERYGYYDEEVVRARSHFHTLNEA